MVFLGAIKNGGYQICRFDGNLFGKIKTRGILPVMN